MDKEQIIEWLQNNLSLESKMIYSIIGSHPLGTEIKIEILHNKEKITLAQTEIYFE